MAGKDQNPNDLGKIYSLTPQLNLHRAIRKSNQGDIETSPIALMGYYTQHEGSSKIGSARESSMADKDQTTNDPTQSRERSSLEAESTKNAGKIDELNKEEDSEVKGLPEAELETVCSGDVEGDTVESKIDVSQEQQFLGIIHSPTPQLNISNSIRKSNQDVLKTIIGLMARSDQHERANIETISLKIDSAQESGELSGGIKSLALSTQHQTTKFQIKKRVDFSQIHAERNGSEEGEESRNEMLAALETGEEEALTLSGYSGDSEEVTEKDSTEDDSEEEFLGTDCIEKSDSKFEELLQTLESDTETSEQEQQTGSEEGFVVNKKTLLGRIAYSSSNDLDQEEGSDGAGDIMTNIEGLEEDMQKIDLENGSEDDSYQLEKEEGDVKLMSKDEKDQHRPKKSLVEWLRGHVELEEDWKSVKEIKAEAVELATELFHLLVNLMFSLPKIDLVDTMFQGLFNSMKYQCKEENSMVIQRILVLLEFAGEEVKRLKQVDIPEEYSETDQDGEFRGIELRENLIEVSHVDQLILQFFDSILCLESTLLREGEPDEGVLVKDLLSALKDDLDRCEKELKTIASRIDEVKEEYKCILGAEDQFIYEMIKFKINELWNQEFESEEDEDQ
ncbi:hypothetical protein SADUNF_Sadunf12G0077000 [Salix dunnii]|uniref:Uncharacterized protein n=1 Tax=Salix dunnii TaxID=1413687 RepID=A0A835MSE5_9ROSI|nr:hypothetical protein SADUNF_Sadunf12G0077000 [Salix dunnii]